MEKPDFKTSIKFIEHTKYRQPMPNLFPLVDSWLETTVYIFENALYKNSSKGVAIDNYNRHLALHLLDDKEFCSEINIVRSFLILQYLFELYLAEFAIPNFQFDMKYGLHNIKDTNTYRTYEVAYLESLKGNSPENNLKNIHK